MNPDKIKEEKELYLFLLECGIGDGDPIKNPKELYKQVCNWIDNLWEECHLFHCWGCGSTGPIEHHHVISRQDMTKIGKPWLVIDPENLFPLCHYCHHSRWHNGGVEKKLELKCLNAMMDFMKKHSNELYMKLYFKIEEYESSCNLP